MATAKAAFKVPTAGLRSLQDGKYQLCDEAATQVASVMTVLRGPEAPYTTAAECEALSAAEMADFHEVPHAWRFRVVARLSNCFSIVRDGQNGFIMCVL